MHSLNVKSSIIVYAACHEVIAENTTYFLGSGYDNVTYFFLIELGDSPWVLLALFDANKKSKNM
ncbi:hypothetical protein RS130_20695 [Paraglaciecola aquimarina]|uniref:Uncharacterized protein n=1 Tax=Paraglaciecola aquimarina TaxID=1235557 RepID=A0ABU3T143_9ALTE|nr:hypothetical protein [Paraglaciecola aquimarina]MDU0355986.1 hypothetical protein [Paraglaciecola aquimarina]